MGARLLAAVLALCCCPAFATSIVYIPHDETKACESLKQLVGAINDGTVWKDDYFRRPWGYGRFFTDAEGEVTEAKRQSFLDAMRNANGKPDKVPLRLAELRRVKSDEDDALYIARFAREKWALYRLEPDGMEGYDRIDDPHYETDYAYWLISFDSNWLETIREARELYPFINHAREIKNCYTS